MIVNNILLKYNKHTNKNNLNKSVDFFDLKKVFNNTLLKYNI